MHAKFERLYEEYLKAKEESTAARAKLVSTEIALHEERKKLVLTCRCGHEQIVGQIELIVESYGGRFNYDSENYDYYSRSYYVCPHCQNVFHPPESDPKLLPGSFAAYVKQVHCWNSDNERLSGRAAELLKVHNEREKARKEEREKRYQLEQAREILRKNGEL